jgi:O-Antigen ligase
MPYAYPGDRPDTGFRRPALTAPASTAPASTTWAPIAWAPTVSVAAVLGFVAPLYVLPWVPPDVLKASRQFLLVVILLGIAGRRASNADRPGRAWVFLAVAYVVAAVAHSDRAAGLFAVTIVVGALAGASIAADGAFPQFLTGFRVAMGISAAVVAAGEFGLPHLPTPVTVTQMYGDAGLSDHSTTFSCDLAIALAAWFWQVPANHPARRWWVVEGALLLNALAVSGGRGGLVGLAIVIMVYPAVTRTGRRAAAGVLSAFLLAVAVAAVSGRVPTTVSRLTGSGRNPAASDDYSNGRVERYQATAADLPKIALFGGGIGTLPGFVTQISARNPHNALLGVFLEAGLLAGVGGVMLSVRTVRLAIPRRGTTDIPMLVGQSVLAVLAVQLTVESLGGATTILLLSMALHQVGAAVAARRPR